MLLIFFFTTVVGVGDFGFGEKLRKFHCVYESSESFRSGMILVKRIFLLISTFCTDISFQEGFTAKAEAHPQPLFHFSTTYLLKYNICICVLVLLLFAVVLAGVMFIKYFICCWLPFINFPVQRNSQVECWGQRWHSNEKTIYLFCLSLTWNIFIVVHERARLFILRRAPLFTC